MFRKKQRDINWTPQQLRDFESNVASIFESGKIHGPVHLSLGNEEYLTDLFQYIHPNDWVFSTWRNHYHALLHGVPQENLMKEILDSHSISFQSPEHNFFTSAIVGGIAPIAVGTALGIKWQNDMNFKPYESTNNPGNIGLECNVCGYKGVIPDLVRSNHEHYNRKMVWCFIGDMAAESGIFYESLKYSVRNELPIHFVVEDNGLSTNTPTQDAWGLVNKVGFCDEAKNEFFKNPLMSKYVSYFTYQRTKYPHQGTGTWIHF